MSITKWSEFWKRGRNLIWLAVLVWFVKGLMWNRGLTILIKKYIVAQCWDVVACGTNQIGFCVALCRATLCSSYDVSFINESSHHQDMDGSVSDSWAAWRVAHLCDSILKLFCFLFTCVLFDLQIKWLFKSPHLSVFESSLLPLPWLCCTVEEVCCHTSNGNV